MARACCSKPIARIIKVAEFEAGLFGLDEALCKVFHSGAENEEEIKAALLQWIRAYGNYIAPSRENDYKAALMREYREYAAHAHRRPERTGRDERKR